MSGEPQPEPMYQPEAFRPLAAHIVEAARQPVLGGKSPRPGIDLGPHLDALAALIADVAEWYEVARDDWEARNVAPPNRDLQRNLDPDEPELGYDYGDAEPTDWAAFFDAFYGRADGNPGRNRQTHQRTDTKPWLPQPPPVPPLYPVVVALERWWKAQVGDKHGQRFSPRFGRDFFDKDRPYDLRYSNPPARLLWLIAERLDLHYTPENLSDLHKQVLRHRANAARKS